MPNQSSHAGIIPIRTCVICKSKVNQPALLSFFIIDKQIIFDIKRTLKTRNYYVCHREACLTLLPKWVVKRYRKTEPLSQIDKGQPNAL
jgi:predicted RNA-binding protein YlxR (DUF448 family)